MFDIDILNTKTTLGESGFYLHKTNEIVFLDLLNPTIFFYSLNTREIIKHKLVLPKPMGNIYPLNNGNFLMRSLEYRGFTGNPNISSFSIVIKLPVIVFMTYVITNTYKKLFLHAIISSSILSVLLLLSRAALIAVVLIFLSLLIYTFINRTRANFINLSLFILAAYISFATYNLTNDKNTNDLLVDRFSTVTNSQADQSVNERANFYKIAFTDIKNNPILGVGIGNWKLTSIQRANKFLEGYRIPFRTHNDFLEVTAEVGIIGGLCFIYFIFFPFLFSFNKIRRGESFNAYHLIFLIVGVYILDSMLNFPMHRPVIINYLFFAFALFHLNDKKLQL